MQESVLSTALSKAQETFAQRARQARYRRDPVAWVSERLGMHLWSKQREVAMSVVQHKRTVVKSCHASGKTFLAALLTCWWIDVHADEEVMVVTTAPTDAQVKKLLWQYIRRIHRQYDLRGTVSEAAEWKSGDRDYIAYGRKPADTNLSAFQGQHVKYLLAIIDEAGGVPRMIFDGVDSITTADTNRVLAIGNPDDSGSEFGRIYLHNDPTWNKLTIRAHDTPNFTGEDVPQDLRDNLISKNWVEEKRQSWGETDHRYVAKVNAEFPDESADTLIPISTIYAAQQVSIIPPEHTRGTLGVDVARFGKDLTAIVHNFGGIIEVVDTWGKTDTKETADRVHDIAVRLGVSEVRIDGVGVGAGVVDQLAHRGDRTYQVVEVSGGAASPDINQWYNYRAFLFDHLRSLIRTKSLSLPEPAGADSPEQQLSDELSGVRYKFKNGALLIESKDDIRKRGGESPNLADALTYAVAPFDVNDPYAGFAAGDTGSFTAEELLQDELQDRSFIISPY